MKRLPTRVEELERFSQRAKLNGHIGHMKQWNTSNITMTINITMTMKIATVKAMKAGAKVKKKRILTKTTKFANKNLIKYTFTSFRLYQLY